MKKEITDDEKKSQHSMSSSVPSKDHPKLHFAIKQRKQPEPILKPNRKTNAHNPKLHCFKFLKRTSVKN